MRKSMFAISFLFLSGIIFGASDMRAAEPYPAKPITFIVPLEAGAAGDVLARPLVQNVSEILGKPMPIVNKPGAAMTLGNLEIHQAKPDGYVIGFAAASMLTSNLTGVSRLTYRDFTLLGTFYTQYSCVFGATKTKRPFKTIEEAISFAKSRPGDVSLSSVAVGQGLWVGAMAFISGTGIKLNVIPQAGGGGLTITQIAGGHADLAVTDLAAAKSQLDAGNIRFLAVLGKERAPTYQNIPTLKEIGYDIVWESTGFIVGPPKMPKDVTDKLVKAFEMAANNPSYHKFLFERFSTPLYLPPGKMIDYFDAQNKVMRDIISKAGILKEN